MEKQGQTAGLDGVEARRTEGAGINYLPIGVIRSPYPGPKGMPIQPSRAGGVAGTVEIQPEYQDGLQDLEGFSHIILIYCLHLSEGYSLKVKPFLDDVERGVFATRAPRRPNPIGLSVVRLVRVVDCNLEIEGVDVVDGTPLLDVKPFVPHFDAPKVERIGWLAGKVERVNRVAADGRFQVHQQG